MRLLLVTAPLLATVSCRCAEEDRSPPAGSTRYVVATPTLTLREAPSAAATALVDIPRGEAVVVTAPPASGWAPAWYAGKEGFALTAFLFPWTPPPADCADFDDWATVLGRAAPDVTTRSPECADDPVKCTTDTRMSFTGGAWMTVHRGYEWGSETMHFPGVRRDEVWAAARSCFNSEPDLRPLGLPTVSGVVPTLTADRHGVTATVDGGRAGWEWGHGCHGYVYVVEVGADTEVVSGGRC